MPSPASSSRRLIAVLVAVAAIWFLRVSEPVTMPLAFALFFVVLLDPVRQRLAGWMPQGAAVGLAFLLALVLLGLFGWGLYEAADLAASGLSDYGDTFASLRSRAEGALSNAGVEFASGSGGATDGLLRSAVLDVWEVAGYLVLILALLALAMSEVPEWRRKLRDRFDDPITDEALETVGRISHQVRRFFVVQAATSALTGVLVGLAAWAIGLDLAFVWGALAALLNLVPTLGSVVSVAVTTLFALLQFGVAWQPAAVFVSLALIEVTLGSYVDPKLQGHYLELSPLVVLVAITFWGWLWGVPGAFIAVPLTAAAIVAFGEFEQTRWLHSLLTRDPPEERE